MPPRESTTRLDTDEKTLGGVVLYVEGGEGDQGKYRALRSGRIVVGSKADCDLVLVDPSVSRRHAIFTATPDGIVVEDLGSTNGVTYVGNRLQKATLRPGARVRLGNAVIAILPDSENLELAAYEEDWYGPLYGHSSVMHRFFATLHLLEETEVTVLLTGETGVGKELVARAIHERSPRSDGPFVTVDCGAIAANLVESELFGHAKGAFTGADKDRLGAVEAATGGTLFLDELGELPLELQPRLLRALESSQVKRVGETDYRQVDVRVVAATNRDLLADVEAGTFRRDVYYRLAVVTLRPPPLREHPEDVPALARHLAEQVRPGAGERLPDSVLGLMARHDWPGNVRELRNAVERLVLLGTLNPDVQPSNSGPHYDTSIPYKEAKEQLLADFEEEYVKALLERHQGNISRAAREAGVTRNTFKELMRKHALG